MHQELWRLDALGQAELIRRGEITPLELVEATIDRIEARNPALNAVVAKNYDRALELARDGELPDGPFRGVPILFKDLLPYPGMINSMGSRLFALNMVAEHTAYSQRLEDAGFIPIGKSATSEFGLLGSTETLIHGTTRNPRDANLSASGSSGGSAAAVAGGLVAIAHASDGGGSIRIPAAVNGLFGLKPSARRTPQSAPMANEFLGLVSDHCVSKSVRDSAAFLDATELKGDAAALPPVGFVRRPVERSLKIGMYSTMLIGAEPEAEVKAALRKTAELCVSLGHDVVETAPPPLDGKGISDAFFTMAGKAMYDMAGFMQGVLGRPVDDTMLEPFTMELIEWFRGLPAGALDETRTFLSRARETMMAYAENFDVLLTPTTGMAPPAFGFLAPNLGRAELVRRTELYAGYTPIHNIAGMCAMSMPLFTTETGLPLGSHFAAGPGQEALLLELAYQLEEAAPWTRRLDELKVTAQGQQTA